MPLVGLVVILVVGLLFAQILVLVPLEFVFALKVPLWLAGLGILIGFAWCLGE
ncbi:hypothetical protein [Phormidesmis priestleyi]